MASIGEQIIHRIQTLDRKSILVFVPTIHEAEQLAKQVPGARAVHSNLPDQERDEIIAGFRAGRIRVVFNVNILATGFDHPGVDCIISARPTASLAWFYQALGRGTRIDPMKKDCLIIDFVGNVAKFGRIENIYFKKKKTWQVYGEGGRLLTGIAMDQIGEVFDAPVSGIKMPFGKHKDKDISAVPRDYLLWMVDNITWTERNYYIKEAAETILKSQAA
jgi:DNA repair protein RadD